MSVAAMSPATPGGLDRHVAPPRPDPSPPVVTACSKNPDSSSSRVLIERLRTMDRSDTTALLRARSAYTSQPYSEHVIDLWHDALEPFSIDEARAALVSAARDHQRISVAHIVERLPSRHQPVSTEIAYPWDGPTDRGRELAQLIRAHVHHEHDEHPAERCPTCYPWVDVDSMTFEQTALPL